MITDLKPYPVMKDSGVPWLGEVPGHWEVRRLGALVRERGESNDDNNVTDVLSVMRERGVIPYAEKGNVGNKKSDDITRYKIVRPDDIVVNCMNVIIGSVGLSKYTGCLSPVYYVLTRRSKIDDPRYLNAYFQTKPFQLSLVRIGNGILAHRMRIPMELLKCEPFPRPPATEQAIIVRYLDYMGKRIRKYIRAKQKLIKLLEEQKQAIIHRAVTRGHDPNVRLKPSGVEWLGDVPEHWEVRRVKQSSQILRGKFSHRPRNDPSLYDGPYPFIQTGEVARAGKSITGYRQTLNERGLAVSKIFPTGTLVMTIAANIGDVAVLDFAACFPDSVVGFVPRSGVKRDYLYYVFRAMKPELLREAPVNTQGNLNIDRIGSRGIALPPPPEQQMIVQQIEESTRGLNAAIERAHCEISLLREYRTRLIADVVTGKLDVREAAARLPDEAEEPELVDEGDAMSAVDEEPVEDLDTVTEEVEA
jgi:type I restriction enzyme S subunit